MNRIIAASLISAGLAAAVPALAQTAGSAADTARGQATQRQHEQRAFRAPTERVEARLAYIKTALKIAPAQESQWNAYANVRRTQASAMEKRFQERRAQMEQRPGDGKRPTVIERRERQREFMAATTQRLDELIAVEKPLYAALTPEQQRVADEVLAGSGRRHGGGHHRGQHGRA